MKRSGRDLGQLRLALGTVLREIGEAMAAVELLQLFVADLDQYPELSQGFSAYGWANLALALRQAKRLDEAISAYEQAIAECRRDHLQELLWRSLQNLAWVCCLSGNLQRAETALTEAEPLCDMDEARWHQRIGQAFLESVAGNRRRTVELCEAIIQGNNAPADVRSHASWLAARVARDMDQLTEAEALANQALSEALQARGKNRCLQDASELLREVRMKKKTGA